MLTMNHWMTWSLVGYLCGSVPFGLLIGRWRGVDIRQAGSGNIGATNVGRVLGKKWGIACFLMDVFKGLLPVLTAGLAMGYAGRVDFPAGDAWRWLAVAAAAMLGHVFPIWLGFKGGKGVATGLGVLLGLWPIVTVPGLVAFATWFLILVLFRYVSLASIIGGLVLPLYIWLHGVLNHQSVSQRWPFMVVSGFMALLVLARHRTNISRLLRGEESQIGSK